MNEIWKDVPGYPGYQASSKGNIRKTYADKEEREISKFVSSDYLLVNLVLGKGIYTGRGVHILVCLAFNGLPPIDGQDYQVNHKDGVKDNNVYTNLEWVTPKENSAHALETGLIRYNVRIRLHDTVSNEVHLVLSMEAAARRFGISVAEAKRYLRLYPNELYQDRYLFEAVLDEYEPAQFAHAVSIKAHDYVTNKTFVTSNAGEMCLMTGVLSQTIINNARLENPPLIGGYVFMLFNDASPFPEHSQEEALQSHERYFGRVSYPKGVVVKNHVDNTTVTYASQPDASKATGVLGSTINTMLWVNNTLPFKGFSFKRPGDQTPFPDYDEDQVQASLIRKSRGAIPYKVKDMVTGIESYHASLKDVAQDFNLARSALRSWLDKYPDRLYQKKLVIKPINL